MIISDEKPGYRLDQANDAVVPCLGNLHNADYQALVSVRWGNHTSEDGALNLRYSSANEVFDGRSVGVRQPEVFPRVLGDFSALLNQKGRLSMREIRSRNRIISTETTVPNWMDDLRAKLGT